MSIVSHATGGVVDTATIVGHVRSTSEVRRDFRHKVATKRNYVAQVLVTTTPLVVSDLLSVSVSLLCVLGVASLTLPSFPAQLLVLLAAAVIFLVFAALGLYPGTGLNPIAEMRQACTGTLITFVGLTVATLASNNRAGALTFAIAGLFCLVVVPLARSAARRICARSSAWGQPVLIFGDNAVGTTSFRFLRRNPCLGLRPIGIVGDLHAHWQDEGLEHDAFLGPLEAAEPIARRHGVYWALVAMPDRPPAEIRQIVERYARTIPHVVVVPYAEKLPSLWTRACDCGGVPAIRITTSLLLPLPKLLKRAIDVGVVSVGGLLCLPLFAGIVFLIKIGSRGPALYSQERITRGGRRFRAWKFRTMVPDAESVLQSHLNANPELRQEWERDHKLRDDPRITPIGRWLRRTSLDELPQIWNVLVGEMSLVGPRPIVESEIMKYKECFDLYVRVLPGITGLWQISGRNNTTYDERVDFDGYYVRNWSPWLDMYILARTFKVVLLREGAY